jgi:drug/metabolite transporter (DMT)-like permease
LAAAWIRNKGLAYMLLAQVFGVLMNVTTRLLEIEGNKGEGLHPFQILFARMSITVVLASAYMWYKKTPHFPLGKPEVRWLLAARGFGGFFGTCFDTITNAYQICH